MFNCQNCGKTSFRRHKPKHVVIETREKEYTGYDPEIKRTRIIGRGWEIAKELICCEPCADSLEKTPLLATT